MKTADRKKTTRRTPVSRARVARAERPLAAGRRSGSPHGAARRQRLPAALGAAIAAAHDKKGTDVVVLDLRKSSAFTDYFILCTGQNVRQVAAIADAIQEALRALRVRPTHVEGYDRAEWVLMDYFDFIIHVFTPSTREFYSLDRLWGQAERIEVPAPGDAATTSGRARA